MSKFTQQVNPIGQYLANGRDFQLSENLIYHVGHEYSHEIIVVPAGFITDWASIPQLLRSIIADNIGKRAAVVHDYLYRTGGLGGRYTRKQSDAIFLESLRVLGVTKLKSRILYRGVRLGGWAAWQGSKKEPYENNSDT